MTKKHLEDIKELVVECVKNNKVDFLSNLIYTLQQNYIELAQLSTDDNYNESWTHIKTIDFITHEM